MSERGDLRTAGGVRRLPFAPAGNCWSCGDPIAPLQAMGQDGVCDRLECRAASARRRMAEERRIEARRRGAARDALREAGLNPDRVSWSLTPANPAALVPLSPARREAFLAHLRRMTREATGPEPRKAADQEDGTDDGRFPPPRDAERQALAVGCATCRGWCCRRGGTHAFLDADRIRRLLRERPDLTPEGVADLYASHLGDDHLEGGCVFQGAAGCGLPRDLRGDTCERYHCPDLVGARRQWREGVGGVHHFVALLREGAEEPRVGETPTPEL